MFASEPTTVLRIDTKPAEPAEVVHEVEHMDPFEFVAILKKRPGLVGCPAKPESLDEVLARVDTPRHVAHVSPAYYLDLARHPWWLPIQMPRHGFLMRECEDVVRLFWMQPPKDNQAAEYYGLRLTDSEVSQLINVFGLKELEGEASRDSGLGPFCLWRLSVGDCFCDYLGRMGIVTTKLDHKKVEVILNPDSIRARRTEISSAVTVYMPDAGQAERARRQKRHPSAIELVTIVGATQ